MSGPAQYKIRVQGELQAPWSAWFAGMAVEVEPGGTSVLWGMLATRRHCTGYWRGFGSFSGLPLLTVERVANIDEQEWNLSVSGRN